MANEHCSTVLIVCVQRTDKLIFIFIREEWWKWGRKNRMTIWWQNRIFLSFFPSFSYFHSICHPSNLHLRCCTSVCLWLSRYYLALNHLKRKRNWLYLPKSSINFASHYFQKSIHISKLQRDEEKRIMLTALEDTETVNEEEKREKTKLLWQIFPLLHLRNQPFSLKKNWKKSHTLYSKGILKLFTQRAGYAMCITPNCELLFTKALC